MATDTTDDGMPPRLLVLDDELPTGETIQRIAEFAGFDAHSTSSPADFFTQVSHWRPDIIALDLIMPEMDGVQVMTELARLGCRARLIITSGVGSRVLDAAERSAREHGLNIVGVIAKPFAAITLRDLLHQALEETSGYDDVSSADRPPPRVAGADDLRQALERGEILPAYQPKVSCRTGTLIGFEALARWQHPTLGVIPPDVFIPLAEAHGLIDRLTRDMAEQALRWLDELCSHATAEKLQRHTLKTATLSLNISARSLGNPTLFDEILQRCHELGISPQRIVLELTETSAMQNPMDSLDTLTRLRLQGYQLSIDDFGTGYSSMVQLVRLPFSEMKVDKRFVMSAPHSEESRAVIRSVVELGRSLGLQTTAEGIEHESSLRYLHDLECDFAQGYLISHPLPADEVLTWFIGRERRREEQRLETLHRLGLLDTPEEPRFDRFTRLAGRLFDVPIALISLMDRDRQWFKSRRGIEIMETPRELAFCNKTLEKDTLMVVEDTHEDPLFRHHPMVKRKPFLRFYAGKPLCLPSGEKLGTLCLLDTKPRSFSEHDTQLLDELAELVEKELALSTPDALDACTGLLNRKGFHDQANAVAQLCHRLDMPIALMTARLDELATVNRVFGREAGNRLLQDLGWLMTDAAGNADLIGRFRGTEITALLVNAGIDTAREAADRLYHAIQRHNASLPPDLAELSPIIRVAELSPGDGQLEHRLRDAWQLHSRDAGQEDSH